MKAPHQHIADTFRGKSGSPYQGFPPRRAKVTPWLVVSTIVTVGVFLAVISALPWASGW